MTSVFRVEDVFHTLPLLLLMGGGVFVLLIEAFARFQLIGKPHAHAEHTETAEVHVVAPWGSRFFLMPLTWLIVAAALGFVLWQLKQNVPAHTVYQGMLFIDNWSLLAFAVCLGSVLLALPSFPLFWQTRHCETGESYVLVLFSLVGAGILIFARHWLALFLGLETMSLGMYVLAGIWRRSPRSSEAALKYFVMGGFVAALLWYGIALLYGTTGSVSVNIPDGPLPALSGLWSSGIARVGLCLVIASLAFKIAAVPFHMWAPDVYEGAPSPITGLMMSVIKTAGLTVVARMGFRLFSPTHPLSETWTLAWYAMAVLTLLVGNLGALRQTNIKRMLAYSSVAHVGYVLIGLLASRTQPAAAQPAVLFYLLGYSVASVGIMGVVTWISTSLHPTEERLELHQWEGLAERNPAAALLMTLFLLSLAGFPPTAGFFGKFSLFRTAFTDPILRPLVWVALLGSLLSVGYYLRVIMAMYFRPHAATNEILPPLPHRTSLLWTVVCAAVLVLGLGLWPNGFFQTVFSGILLAGG